MGRLEGLREQEWDPRVVWWAWGGAPGYVMREMEDGRTGGGRDPRARGARWASVRRVPILRPPRPRVKVGGDKSSAIPSNLSAQQVRSPEFRPVTPFFILCRKSRSFFICSPSAYTSDLKTT